MPELPEVQTIVNDLNKRIARARILDFFSYFPKAVKMPLSKFRKEVTGGVIKKVSRRAKHILMDLDSGKIIVVHLKMTGQLLVDDVSADKGEYNFVSGQKYVRHYWELEKKGKRIKLQFSDVRKFGVIGLIGSVDELNKIGLEPLSDDFTVDALMEILDKRKRSPMKSLLMDQALIAGIGNIYASEILHESGLDPRALAGSLPAAKVKELHCAIRCILAKAIEFRGTTFSDYRDSKGEKGGFQDELKVYGRKGEKCRNCDNTIERTVIGQRSTFWCPGCQG